MNQNKSFTKPPEVNLDVDAESKLLNRPLSSKKSNDVFKKINPVEEHLSNITIK